MFQMNISSYKYVIQTDTLLYVICWILKIHIYYHVVKWGLKQPMKKLLSSRTQKRNLSNMINDF